MEQCTLYLTLGSAADLPSLVEERFSGWSVTVDGPVITVAKKKFFSKQRIVFSVKSREADGEAFDGMMHSMHAFYAAIPTEKEAVKSMLLAQLQVFTVTAGVVADKDMDDETFGRVIGIAEAGNGLVLLPPADLYTPSGDMVFNAQGESDLDSHKVFAPSDLLDRQTAVTEEGLERRERTNALLESQGVPVCASLPPIVGDRDYTPRTKEEVAERTIAIMTAAVFAECAGSQGIEKAREIAGIIMEQYGSEPFLSPAEREFVTDPGPEGQDVTNFSWRYECAWVGLWALGFVDELSYPDGICDVPALAGIIRECGSFETFLARSALRSPAAILDAADRIYRYDWACADARVRGAEAPANLMPGVVMERHRMLNWLVRYMDAGWDEVRTDT